MDGKLLTQFKNSDEKIFITAIGRGEVVVKAVCEVRLKGDRMEKPWETVATMVSSEKECQINYIKKCKYSTETCNKLAEVYNLKGPFQKVMLYKK